MFLIYIFASRCTPPIGSNPAKVQRSKQNAKKNDIFLIFFSSSNYERSVDMSSDLPKRRGRERK